MKVSRPCPKCGSRKITVYTQRLGNRFAVGTDHFVKCEECGHSVHGMSEFNAIRRWENEDGSEVTRNV